MGHVKPGLFIIGKEYKTIRQPDYCKCTISYGDSQNSSRHVIGQILNYKWLTG